MNRCRAALLSGACLLVVPAGAPAQTSFSAGLGENADAATGATSGQTLFFGVSRFGSLAGAGVGVGLPLDPDLGSRWASAAGWLDAPDLVQRFGILGSVQAFGYRDPVLASNGGAASAEIQAYVPFDAGPARVRVRAGGRAGGLSDGVNSVRRALGVGGVDATMAADPVLLRAAVDVWAASEAVYPQASLQAVASTGRLLVHGRVARWFHGDLPETGWGVGARVGLTDRLALVIDASRPETDVLFSSPVQRSWSVGLRLGAAPVAAIGALPAPVFAEAGETVRLRVEAPGGGPVRLAGTFNGWQPDPMRAEGGRWVAELRLPPGVYEYAFVAADGTWFVPEDMPGRKPDGFGGFVATLVVR